MATAYIIKTTGQHRGNFLVSEVELGSAQEEAKRFATRAEAERFAQAWMNKPYEVVRLRETPADLVRKGLHAVDTTGQRLPQRALRRKSERGAI